MYGIKNLEVQVQKMWLVKRVRFFLKTFKRRLSELFSDNNDNSHKNDSNLETEHGRRNGGGDSQIKRFTQRLWDTSQKRKRVERVLRSASRKEEDERVQKEKTKISERNLRLKRIYQSKDFEEVKTALMEKEGMAYFGLSHPETKKPELTNDYYFGYMSGRLSIINEIREMFERAIISLDREAIKKEKEDAL